LHAGDEGEPTVGGRPVAIDGRRLEELRDLRRPMSRGRRDERPRPEVRGQEEHRRGARAVEVERVRRPGVEEDRPLGDVRLEVDPAARAVARDVVDRRRRGGGLEQRPDRGQHRGLAARGLPDERADGARRDFELAGRALALDRESRQGVSEDDGVDEAPDELALLRNRGDRGYRPLEREVVADGHLHRELAAQLVDKAHTAVDAPSGQEPILAAPRLLVPAEKDAALPAEDGRDTDARLERHQWAELPKPLSPRSLAGSSGTSLGSVKTTGTTTSCAIRIPGSTTNASSRSVLRSTTLTSPR